MEGNVNNKPSLNLCGQQDVYQVRKYNLIADFDSVT